MGKGLMNDRWRKNFSGIAPFCPLGRGTREAGLLTAKDAKDAKGGLGERQTANDKRQ